MSHPPYHSSTPIEIASPLEKWPHDEDAFTEGLAWHNGEVFESVGIAGKSEVRRIDLRSGAIMARRPLLPEEFGEGITILNDRLYQLTYTSGRCYVYEPTTLSQLHRYEYAGEGWGLANDGDVLYMSDGSCGIRLIEPTTFRTIGKILVSESGTPVTNLNELEWINGELFANVFQTSLIARIQPATGAVSGWIDVSRLISERQGQVVANRFGMANGIAFDRSSSRLLITGKYWPSVVAVRLRTA